jgi:hypothetical protein
MSICVFWGPRHLQDEWPSGTSVYSYPYCLVGPQGGHSAFYQGLPAPLLLYCLAGSVYPSEGGGSVMADEGLQQYGGD